MEDIIVAIQNAADTIATPNWATVLSAIAAILAVVVAGVVAWKQYKIAQVQNEIAKEQTEISKKQADISEKQNKIALFKERYLVYTEYQKIINISAHMKNIEDLNKRALLYAIALIYGQFTSDYISAPDKILTKLLAQFKVSEYQIRQTEFLFYGIEESEINNLLMICFELLLFIANEDDTDNTVAKKFVARCNYFEENCMHLMVEQLKLK